MRGTGSTAPGLERRTVIEGDASYTNLNWLFAPEPPGASFWAALARWRQAIARTSSVP